MNTESPSFSSLFLQELAERLAASEARHEAAEARLQTAEAYQGRYQSSERRFRILCGVLLGAITVTTVLPFLSPAMAQGYGVTLTSLATRVTALETWRTTATNQISTLDTDLGVVETKTASMSVITDPNTSQPTVRFSNVNVQIVDGSGDTFSPTNGRGNLIIGYNELLPNGNDRTGSHNLVVGAYNNYTSAAVGGMVVGFANTISNIGATVSGGFSNTASGGYSSVSGGSQNTASSNYSSVSGGALNTASGNYSSVSGGFRNTASGRYSTVSGGVFRTASAENQWVGGSTGNAGRGGSGGGSGGGNSTLGGGDNGNPKGGL